MGNQLSTTVDMQDKILSGLKLTFDSTFSPQSGAKSGKIKAEYKHDLVTLNTDVDINLGGPLVNASAVIGHQGWLAGYQLAFDTGKSTLDKNASLRAKVNNSSQVGLGYQQKLRDGVTLTLSTLIDGKNIQQGGHKLGLALELEA